MNQPLLQGQWQDAVEFLAQGTNIDLNTKPQIKGRSNFDEALILATDKRWSLLRERIVKIPSTVLSAPLLEVLIFSGQWELIEYLIEANLSVMDQKQSDTFQIRCYFDNLKQLTSIRRFNHLVVYIELKREERKLIYLIEECSSAFKEEEDLQEWDIYVNGKANSLKSILIRYKCLLMDIPRASFYF